MDTDALRWFQQVADGTTVTEVSELEGVTQSGVSRALARLETEVGTPLLQRSGRILRMTHAGSVFKHHVDAMLHQLDDGIAAVSQLLEPETGTVALAFQHSLGTWLVPYLVRSFRTAHPQVRFELTQVRDEMNSEALAGGRADLEIGTRRPHDAALLTRRRLTDDLCAAAGFRPDVVFEGDDLSTVRGFVAAGLGVAVVPAPRAGSPESATGPLVHLEILDPGAVREITLTWSAERRLLAAPDLFRRYVLRRATAGRVPTLS
jgi:DNA-binding transcriptional LysR family regulator